MADGINFERLMASADSRLVLEDIRDICTGMTRATQKLAMGDDLVCTDEVLIEEVTYPLADEMAAETNSMSIKIGMLSPFTRSSVYPPKYFFCDKSTAWFVSSVPPVSLAMVLAEIAKRFPAHYTYDRLAYVRDMLQAVTGAARCAWAMRRRPVKALQAGVATFMDAAPRRLRPAERMQMAALLVDAVRPKHATAIYHNNITPHTVFFADGLTPKVLCNYAGVVPPLMQKYIPERILNRSRTESFGEQSVDTYSLALIAYELITGERLEGPAFTVDDHPVLEVPAHLRRRLAGGMAWLNVFFEAAREAYAVWWRVTQAWQATLDERRYPNFRKLTRATGSVIRSIPVLRNVLDIWLPTETALVLRSILDDYTNTRVFGMQSRLNRLAITKRNANCAYLRAALPASLPRRRSRVAQFVQEVIDSVQERPVLHDEDEVVAFRFGHRFDRPYLIRYALAAVVLLLVCAGSSRHQAVPARLRGDQGYADSAGVGMSRTRGCDAHLVENRRFPGVYRITDMRRRCLPRDIVVPPDSATVLPQTLGEAFARLYVSPRSPRGYGELIEARQCPSELRGCEPQQFYRIVGLGGLGERVDLSEGDIVGFEREAVEAYLRSLDPLPYADTTATDSATGG